MIDNHSIFRFDHKQNFHPRDQEREKQKKTDINNTITLSLHLAAAKIFFCQFLIQNKLKQTLNSIHHHHHHHQICQNTYKGKNLAKLN